MLSRGCFSGLRGAAGSQDRPRALAEWEMAGQEREPAGGSGRSPRGSELQGWAGRQERRAEESGAGGGDRGEACGPGQRRTSRALCRW